MENYSYVVGIDLGTTNTLACYYRNGKRELVKFPSRELLPSVIYVGADGKISVGQKAINKGVIDARNMVRSSKKYIGDYETNMVWNLNGQKFTPTDVATEILKEVKKNFVKAVGCPADEKIGAVITVPAYFNNNQRNETRKAGEAAGFDVMWILEEPMAAAIAAVHEEQISKKVFVVDIGGGTFDLSVLQADEKNHIYKAIALDGDPQLGGDDFDAAMVDKFTKIIEDESGREIDNNDKRKLNLILKAAQEAKLELSTSEETSISVNDIFDDYDFNLDLTRDDFNDICQDTFDKIFNRTKKFLNDNNKFKITDIGYVILAGGSCFIPYIESEVEKIFGFAPVAGLDKEKLVAYGAALVAQSRNNVESGAVQEMQIEGIIPHSLGIEVVADNGDLQFFKILSKNTEYPCHNSDEFTTTRDNQTQIDINVYEAGNDTEDKLPIQYHKLYGSLQLDIAPMPKGVPTIEVRFDYDENQRLTVTAIDKKTGNEEMKVIKSGERVEKPQAAPVDLMLLMDTSGSMRGRELQEAQKASRKLVTDMIDLSTHRMGLIAFESSPKLLCELTHDGDTLQQKINELDAYGGTNMIGAFGMAYTELENSTNERIALMVTDGYPDRRNQTVAYAQNLRNKGLQIYAIGVGEDMDIEFLREMVGNDNAFVIDTMEQLTETFKQVISLITKR